MLHIIPASALGVPPSPPPASFSDMGSSLLYANHRSSQHTAPPPPPHAPILALHGRLLTFLALPPTARPPDLDGARGFDTWACALISNISCFFSRSALASSAAGPSVRSPAEALASVSSALAGGTGWAGRAPVGGLALAPDGTRQGLGAGCGAHGLEFEVSAFAAGGAGGESFVEGYGARDPVPQPRHHPSTSRSPAARAADAPQRLARDVPQLDACARSRRRYIRGGVLDEAQAAMRAEAGRRKRVAIAEAWAGRSRKRRAAVWIVNLDRCFLMKSLAFPQQRAYSANSCLEYIEVSRPLYSSAMCRVSCSTSLGVGGGGRLQVGGIFDLVHPAAMPTSTRLDRAQSLSFAIEA
ncbi:hypothetical protein FB451DRAFT_1487110 [Mycena latifolia]|nr:hypothetical protein FB451DRAFT_1487110 [Mycena latifolia]